MEATLLGCVPTIVAPTLTDQSYDIATAAKTYVVDEFTYSPTACIQSFTYSMSYTAAGSGLTNDNKITFDAATRTVSFESDDMT